MSTSPKKKNLLRSTGLRPRHRTRSRPLAPLRAVERIERSWSVVSKDVDALGVDFFTRVFLDVPAALDLFVTTLGMSNEEMDAIKNNPDRIRCFVLENKLIKAHARLVIMEVGRCVAGLYDTTVLVPRLRSLGRMHGAAGVRPEHYDVFFRHLMETVRDHVTNHGGGKGGAGKGAAAMAMAAAMSVCGDGNGGAGDVGGDYVWDRSTEEAWGTAKDCMRRILSRPDEETSWDGGAGLNRWGSICAAASLYACAVAPLRVAGMIGRGNVAGAPFSFRDWILSFRRRSTSGGSFFSAFDAFGFAFLDAAACAVFAVELLLGCVVLRLVRVKDLRKVRNISSRRFRRATLFGKAIVALRWLGIHESVTFPVSDVVFLLSYLIQYHNMTWFGRAVDGHGGYYESSSATGFGSDRASGSAYLMTNGSSAFEDDNTAATFQSTDNPMIVGVHWTWAFGILRLVAIIRAVYAVRKMQLAYTVANHSDELTRLTMRTAWLVAGLAYTSHVAACLYVLVARIELGAGAYYDPERPEALSTSFFPDHTILGRENGALTDYLRCVHFAFTNLAGIGNHDSAPRSALECAFTLAVNAVGATLYAFATGLLLSMIEPAAGRANRFGEEAASLTEYMIEVGMDAEDQDKIIQGFILQEMSGNGGGGSASSGVGRGPFAPAPGENCSAPAYPADLVRNLPRYLQEELRTVATVDAMRRRERAFRRCSEDFLAALASSLKQSVTLLPGDYIVREGHGAPTQLLIVESGSLEVVVDGSYVRTFERGDMISFHWVDSVTRSSTNGILNGIPSLVILSGTSERRAPPRGGGGGNGFSPLLLCEPIAGASVRSMDHCRIATGLSSREERRRLKKRYPNDWRELEEVIENARGNFTRKRTSGISGLSAAGANGDGAPIVITDSVHNNNGGAEGISVGTTKSVTRRVRRFSTLMTHSAFKSIKH